MPTSMMASCTKSSVPQTGQRYGDAMGGGPKGSSRSSLACGTSSCRRISSPTHRLELVIHLSLSRLNHWLPRGQAHPEVVQGTAEFHHQITDSLLPQANPIFHDATALHTTIDMLDPEP